MINDQARLIKPDGYDLSSYERAEPDALEEVPTRSSCPAVPVRSVMLNVIVKKIPFSP